jgi:uncharacterized pyridoxamine 5'-phosphate oxidase family protein
MGGEGHMFQMQAMLKYNKAIRNRNSYFKNKDLYLSSAKNRYHKSFKQLTENEKMEIRAMVSRRKWFNLMITLSILIVTICIIGWIMYKLLF